MRPAEDHLDLGASPVPEGEPEMRRFELHRDEDPSGVSGIGVVAQGVRFDDGTCVLRWLSQHRSTALYASAKHIELIHGHQGRTRLVWLEANT